MSRGCDSCQVLTINGHACHEMGCPKHHINPVTGNPYRMVCKDCGRKFPARGYGKDAHCDKCCREFGFSS